MSDSIAPKPKSTAQLVMEGIVDAVAIAGVVMLTYVGKLPGELAGILIAALAGVRVIDLVKGNGGPPTSGGGGIGGVAGLFILGLSGLAHGLSKVSRVSFASAVIRTIAGVSIAAALAGGCVHRNGQPFTSADYARTANTVYKFTLDEARDLCDVVRRAGPAVSVMFQGAAVPIVVANAACGLLDLAIPRLAPGVVVYGDGTGHVFGSP